MNGLQTEALQAVERVLASGLRPYWQPAVASFLWRLAPLFSLAVVASHYSRSKRLLRGKKKRLLRGKWKRLLGGKWKEGRGG